MAYDEQLADRISRAVEPRSGVTVKKMFGGLCFLLDGKMFCGIVKDDLMVRVGPDHFEAALAKAHVRPMDFTGRPMIGYLYIGPGGSKTVKAIKSWVDQAATFVATLETGTAKKSRKARASSVKRAQPAKRAASEATHALRGSAPKRARAR